MMIKVIQTKYTDGYRIWIKFSDGKEGIVNLENDLWGPMFESLKDINNFIKFKVSPIFHTLVWENEADLSPEYLYEHLEQLL